MKDMKKDQQIEERFREYFDGNETPACDLTHAKRLVEKKQAAVKKERRVTFLKVASLLACLAIIVTVCVSLPSFFPKIDDSAQSPDPLEPTVYALSQTVSRPLAYEEAKENYAAQTSPFTPFEWADNASCAYTLYELDNQNVLLRADLRYGGGMHKFDATVYIDLTGGKRLASDFSEHRALGNNGIDTKYLNGEYVSAAYTVRAGTAYYADVLSPKENAAEYLVNYILK